MAGVHTSKLLPEALRKRLDDEYSPLGRGLLEARDLLAFSSRGLAGVTGAPRYASEVMRQLGLLVRGTTLFVFFMCFFIGYSATNFAFYILRSAGASDYLGFFTAVANPQSAAMLLFGYAFCAKVGGNYVAEIGAMKINEEISGYESEGVDPMRYIVGTRVAATMLFIPIAAGVALIAMTVGEYISLIVVLEGLSPSGFFRFHWPSQILADQIFAFAVMFITGTVIALIGCFYGMRASGGPASVGSAVARAVVVNLVVFHLLQGAAVVFYYTRGVPPFPIGG